MNEDYFATHGQGPIDSRDQRLLRTLVGRIRLNQDRGNPNVSFLYSILPNVLPKRKIMALPLVNMTYKQIFDL